MGRRPWRFVVVVEVAAPSLSTAYEALHKGLTESFGDRWEGTSQVFDGDTPVGDARLARMYQQRHWKEAQS